MKIVSPTIIVGVYGSIHVHPWIEPEVLEEDTYSIFVSRAVSMGWSSTGPDGLTVDLWGMNDAGQDWSPRSSPTRVAWYQVGLANPSPDGGPLPIQPILACVNDSLNRTGELALTAVQLLLPLHLCGSAQAYLISGLNWFGTSDPGVRVPIRVTLDAGEGEEVRQKAPEVLATLQRLNTGPFTINSLSPEGSVAVELNPAVVDDMWLGESRHPVTFEGTVPEWTFDSLGWVVTLFAEACRRAGVRTTVLASVSMG